MSHATTQSPYGLNVGSLIWVVFILFALYPVFQQRMLFAARMRLLSRLGRRRGSRVITLIHRQEAFSFLGLSFARYIDIDDSELVLQAIRQTPDDAPIDLILHTPGGLALAAEQIAHALVHHGGKVTVFVPHYAMSGGTLVALAADEIVMDEHAALGPVDPQIGQYPAVSLLKAVEQPNPNRDDATIILADVARKAVRQMHDWVVELVGHRLPSERAKELATALSEGRWTHDYPITIDEARRLGLPVSTELPQEIYALMTLYPQAGRRRPSVEFVPYEGPPPQPPAPTPGPKR
jgi:ClpP class serine protease